MREIREEFPWTTTQTESRSKGLHLTDVIHAIGETIYHTQGSVVNDEVRLQWEKGWLWEVALSRAFGEKAAIRIGEIELDGVIGSPDGINYDENGEVYVEEYKATAFSSSKTPADVWGWMMQVKGYCKMVGCVKCVFRVLYVRDIGRGDAYRVYELTFTQAELDENWLAITSQAAVMRKGNV